MADGKIVFETALDNKTLEKELNKLNRKIQNLNDQVYIKQQQKMPLVEQAKRLGVELDTAKAKLASMQSGEKFYTSAHIQAQADSVEQLQKEWNKVNDQIDRMDKGIQAVQIKADVFKEQAGEISSRLSSAGVNTERMSQATRRAANGAQSFARQMKFAMSSILLYGTLFKVFSALTEWISKLITVNAEAAQSVARLKGALLTLIQPLVQIIIPAFSTLVNLLAAVVSKVASLVSVLFGTTAKESAKAASGLYDEMAALEGTGAAAEEASKSLASFDEINQLSGDTAAGTAGAASGVGETTPDFDTAFIKNGLDKITTLLAGALLAVGAVLTFSGSNIPLGIGLMAAGALILGGAVAENWDAISRMLQGPLGAITALLGGSLLVLGAIIAFSGANIPLGVGLMVTGALGLAASVAANWNSLTTVLQGPIGVITALLSASLLAVGAIIAFSFANPGLGIGLMAVGAVGLAASVSINWDYLTTVLQGPIGAITGILSGALLVLGAILTFSNPSTIPLGIGLLAIGAAGLATSVVANWDTIQGLLQGPIGIITALLSSALLVLGAILTLSGAAIPLGIGLIAAGAVGLVTSISANWDFLTTTLGSVLDTATSIVSAALLVLGVILIFTGAGVPLGLGMLLAAGVGLATSVAPNWDFILEAVQGAWSDLKSWWGTNVQKYFTADYWMGVGKNMLDGLFNGLSNIGNKITSWGGEFIDGVKDFFGIHSPSTEFETLGDYMMAGLGNGVSGNTSAVVALFSTMFNQITALCSQNTSDMTSLLNAFLLFLTATFLVTWKSTWDDCYSTASQKIRAIMSEVDSLNAKLASIERNITITITTVYRTIGSSSGSGSTSSGAAKASAKSVSLDAASRMMANIPRLAEGRVIPPNREFMAVLGDQTSGTNIETPLETMVQAFRQALSSMDYGRGEATMEVDGQQFGKLVYKYNNKESRRVGTKFVEA